MSESLELGLQVVVCHLIWVLGAKHGSSAGAVSAPNCRNFSPAPIFIFKSCVYMGLKGWRRRVVHMTAVPTEESITSPEVGETGHCEPLSLNPGNQAWVPRRNSDSAYPQNSLSSVIWVFSPDSSIIQCHKKRPEEEG